MESIAVIVETILEVKALLGKLKPQDRKKKMHYTPKNYLSAWRKDGGVIFMEKRKINKERRNPESVGREIGFYALPSDFSIDDILFVLNHFVANMRDDARDEFACDFINYIMNLVIAKFYATSAPVVDLLEKELNNYIENAYSKAESRIIPKFKDIDCKQCLLLANKKERNDLIYFMLLQYFRTRMMRERVKLSFIQSGVADPLKTYESQIIRSWSILAILLAMDSWFNLMADDGNIQITLVEADESCPFVTGDQPVISLGYDYSGFKENNEMQLYFPLTPTRAVILTHKCLPMFKGKLTCCNIIFLNDAIVNASYEQVYAMDDKSLKRYVND